MRRVLAFLRWKTSDWLRKGDPHLIASLTGSPHQLEGLRAYAFRQAKIFSDVRNNFLGIWTGLELPQEHLTEHNYLRDLNSDMMELDGDDA
jgi:hypothetical protein